jgi:predicted ribosome quality control (RQC) complex YloA/Tae2 family protein
LVIKLDPELSALENAQRYFERYNKAKRALDDVPRLIEENEASLAFVQQLGVDLDLASSYPDIDEVQQSMQMAGLWRGEAKRVPGGQKSAPLKLLVEDWLVWIGRNSRQNEQVTFDKGSPNDLWLHVRDVPGAHVIIKSEGRPVPEHVVERAAEYAAFYSPLRGEAKAPVDVTLRAHVRKVKGAAAGMVTYRNERTIMVSPRGQEA